MSAKCRKLHEILSLHFMWLLGQFRVACAAWVDEDQTESQSKVWLRRLGGKV